MKDITFGIESRFLVRYDKPVFEEGVTVFSKEKISMIWDALEEDSTDMWIVAGQESATNSEPVLQIISDIEFIGCTALVFCRDRTCYAVCTPIDRNGYIHEGVFNAVFPFPVSFAETLAEVIRMKNPEQIALDYSAENPAADGLSLGMFRILEEAFRIAGFRGEIRSAEKMVVRVRGIKTEEELGKIRKACAEAEKIFRDAASFIRPGMNCRDVFRFFQEETERRGFGYAWPKSCNPSVASGAGCPAGHVGAPDYEIRKGAAVNVDFGIICDGYSCDLQRMYYLPDDGEEDVPDDVQYAFETIRDAIAETSAFLKPGVLGVDADRIGREYVTYRGFDEFGCALGHQLGRVAHDGGPLLAPAFPRYDKDELIRTPLHENMVFTLEPGIDTRVGHIGLEEDVVIRKNGAEFLSDPQKELILIKGE